MPHCWTMQRPAYDLAEQECAGHDRHAGLHRDAFACLERTAQEYAPAGRRLFSAEGGVRQASHAGRLLSRRTDCS